MIDGPDAVRATVGGYTEDVHVALAVLAAGLLLAQALLVVLLPMLRAAHDADVAAVRRTRSRLG